MKRVVPLMVVAIVVLAQALAAGQGGDVDKILAEARKALGGEKRLAELKTFQANGRSTRVVGETSTAPSDAEIAFELPDKFMRKDALASMGGMAITRTSGYNGEAVINNVDQPPAGGGMVVIRMAGPGGGAPGEPQTPEQQEQARQLMLRSSKEDHARIALGMLLPVPSYPLQYSYAGVAESPDGKADVIDVKGEGDFAARLFIDQATHVPLMLSWMAKEPLVLTQTVRGGPGGAPPAGGHAAGGAWVGGGGGNVRVQSPQNMTPEERDKMMKDMEERRKQAEATRRVVEYRLFYGGYRKVDGVMVPFTLQRSIDGKPTEELVLERVRIDERIDPKKFEPSK